MILILPGTNCGWIIGCPLFFTGECCRMCLIFDSSPALPRANYRRSVPGCWMSRWELLPRLVSSKPSGIARLKATVIWRCSGRHHFRTIPFELLGLRFLARRGWGVLLHGASGRAWNDNGWFENFAVNHSRETIHEIGFSLSGLFSVARVDVTRRLSTKSWFAA